MTTEATYFIHNLTEEEENDLNYDYANPETLVH